MKESFGDIGVSFSGLSVDADYQGPTTAFTVVVCEVSPLMNGVFSGSSDRQH